MALRIVENVRRRCTGLRGFWRRFRKNRGAVGGLLFLILLVLAAILAGVVTVHDPMRPGVGRMLEPPSLHFLMGTDNLGRDLFSGVVHGARVSLIVGCAAAFAAALIGTVVGSISGYFGGWVDDLLMRVCEVFQSMPRFLFALIIVAFFGNSIWNVTIVLGILGWPTTARMIRSQFLLLRQSDFVMAARALGTGGGRIIFREILPNAVHVIIVNTSLEIGTAILSEAGLSFLGAGDPNVMSWGRMLFNAQRFLRDAWWFSLFPGLAIFATVLSLNLVGDGLNDALNPKLRRVQHE